MIRIGRAAVVGVFGGLGVAASAGPAAAQFGGGFGLPAVPVLPSVSAVPTLRTPGIPTVYGNPLNFSYGRQYQVTAVSPLGGTGTFRREFYGPAGLWGYRRYAASYAAAATYNPLYAPTYSSYMSGGVKNAAVDNAAKDFARAQQMQAAAARNARPGARNAIYDQWAYERLDAAGLAGLRAGGEAPAALAEAMAAPDPAAVASGDALNHVLVGVVAAEPKGARVESAYVSPLILDKVRFGGSPAADAINLLRQAGRVPFPEAFESGPLADLRPAVDRELAAAAAPALAGKVPEAAKVAALEATAGKARKEVEAAVLDMGFEEAIAARRFVNRLDATVKALRAPGAAGLVDPRWAAEGVSVADLARHMTKAKLLFGPAPRGGEDAYLALHRGLVVYLAGLAEAQKAGARK
ncbi:MAG: hypothetical protein K2X87_17480 [Gemmataceae bacterium]|nr:hypothetical protein [Gemmataceae bacterium]